MLAPLALAAPARALTSELFFSEYVEGSSNNKALEMFNGTGAAVDLAAGGYNIQMFLNGSAFAGLTIGLFGTVADGDVFVLAQALASPSILAQADQTNGAGWFNGDDAVVLRHGTTVLDVIGQVGFDPGTEWGAGLTSTADNTLRRNDTVLGGDQNGSDAFDPSAQWAGFATDTFDGLGSHSVVDGETAPAVASTSPANNATGVAVDANLSVTFSEPVDLGSDPFGLSCTSSGTNSVTVSGGPTTFTLDPGTDFVQGETCTATVTATAVTDQDTDDPPNSMAADHSWSFATVEPPAPSVKIHEVQATAHLSPLAGDKVEVEGVVTAEKTNGFWLQEQDAETDRDPATSQAVFVFTSDAPTVDVGDAATVVGTVVEFRPGGASSTNLTLTEISSPGLVVTVSSTGNPLPAATVIGAAGRVPPGEVIDDDASGSVETSGSFDAATDGIDFYESLEGMRVQVNNAVVTGPRSDFGELWVVGDGGTDAALRTARDGIVIRPGDFNPERIQVDDGIPGVPTPSVNVGATFGAPIVGVLDYNFGNFELLPTAALVVGRDELAREVTRGSVANELSVANFNVENLSPSNTQAKFDELAGLIINNLKAPDLVILEEIQDNSGPTNDGVVDASLTLDRLIDTVSGAGGPTYQFRQIDPVNNQDGGQPGGNIRVGFLFRTDRGLAFVDRPGGGSRTPTTVVDGADGPELSASPGRIDPDNSAWSNSRKPLVGEFMYNGHKLFVVGNHFNSKGGDQPLFGRFQPPTLSSETQRLAQAGVVKDFVDEIQALDPAAKVVVG
ncbi:MAG: Ig-like domain-containing protein, partial [Actinomycetes bacterium]